MTGLTAVGVSQLLPLPAAFGQSYYYGTLTATISLFQAVRSITLSPGTVTFTNCQGYQVGPLLGGLTASNNGQCISAAVTVTVGGNVGSIVSVQGAPATANDFATNPSGVWNLCGGVGDPLCSGGIVSPPFFGDPSAPGPDRYNLLAIPNNLFLPSPNPPPPPPGVFLASSQANTDTLFPNPAPPASFVNESLWLTGPFSTTDTTATSFSTTVSWIAS